MRVTPLRSSLAVVFLSLSLMVGCGWKLQTRGGPSADAGGEGEGVAPARAPGFSLANDDGVHVSLDELLATGKPAILVFYRGHW